MFRAWLVLALAPAPEPAPAPPAEAVQFGIPAAVAEANRRTADRHYWARWDWAEDRMGPFFFNQWRRDMEDRCAAWARLAEALDPARAPADRAQALGYLRLLIGDEAYRARWMPSPIPSYSR